jgi:hypothetical protein
MRTTHDGSAARLPWSPTAIAAFTCIFSPVVGGVLHGLNEGRLGDKARQRFSISRNLLAGLLLLLLTRSPLQTIGASFFFAAYFYKTQEERFREHLAHDGRAGALVVLVFLALGGAVLLALLAFALNAAIG